MMWWFSFGWLCRALEQRRKHRSTRRWVKFIRPFLEPLEERRLFTNNVWLPQQLAAFDGTTQTSLAAQLFQPATTTLLPQLGLQGTSVSVGGQFSLTDTGNYQLSQTQSGPYDANGDRYTFTESGPVTFSLTALGSFTNTGFSTSSLVLTQTASLSWSFVETDSSGQTVQNLSGSGIYSTKSGNSAPFVPDPYFADGFNWLSLALLISSADTLNLSNLAADSLSVTESNGSENYLFQETNGVATVQGNVQQPLSDSLLQSGQDSYSETAVEQFNSTQQGGDSFSLSELGSYDSSGYSLSSVAYQETGTQSSSFNATVTDSQSGTASESGTQSFSGSNHTLGDSSSDSFQFTSLQTAIYGESASSGYTLTEDGSFGGGSFGLGSLSYTNIGTGGYGLTQTATQTQTGSFSDSSNASGTDSYGIGGTLTDGGTATDGGNFTATSNSTLLDNESGNFTLSASGAYGNASWALSSFNLTESLSGTFSQQQLGTTTQQGNSTAIDSDSGSDSFLLNFGASDTSSGSDTSTSSDTQTDSFTLLSTSSSSQGGASSYTLSELGAVQGGSASLTSFVFTSGQSGTWSATGQANETDIGTGQDSVSGSDNSNETASNGSFNDNLSGSDNFSANDSYSFTSTDSSSSSDGGGFNQSVYQAGVYSNGSYALSSVVDSSGQNDNYSDTSADSSTDSGSDGDSSGGSGQNNDTVLFGTDSTTAQDSNSFSESDSGTFLDTAFDTIAETGYFQFALTQVGSYGNDSFGFTTVTYNGNGTSNETIQDSEDDNYTDTITDSSSGGASQTGVASLSESTDTASEFGSDSSNDNYKETGLDTLTETVTSTDSATTVEIGSFLGGVWNLSNVSATDSASDSFSSQDVDSSTDSGTDGFSSLDSGSSSDTSVYGGGSLTASGSGHDTVMGSDTFTEYNNATLTDSGNDSFLLTEQGIFANFSFNLSSVVYQGGDNISDTFVEASHGTSVGAETVSFSDNGSDSGVGTYSFGGGSTSYSGSDSGSDTLTTGGSDSLSETVTGSESDSFYEAGQFMGGSLSLSVVSLSSSGSDTYSEQSQDTSMDSGTLSESGNDSSSWFLDPPGLNPSIGSSSASDAFSRSGSDSATSYDSSSDSGSDSWSLYELGSFVNGSFSFGSFVSQDGGSDNYSVSDSATDSFNGTVTDSTGGSDSQSNSGTSGPAQVNAQSGDNGGNSDDFHETDLGQSNQTVTGGDSWSDYQAGILSGNSWALSSVSDSSSGSDSWTDQSNDTITDNGQETIYGGLSFSGADTVSGISGFSATSSGTTSSAETLGGTDTSAANDSSNGSGSDSWSQVEQGSYGNYSFAFSSVVLQSGDSFSDSFQDTATDTFLGSWSNSASSSGQESGTDDVGQDDGGDNSQSSSGGNVTENESIDSQDTLTGGDSENESQYESGSYAGGSYAFTSLSYQDSGSDSSTLTDNGTSSGTFTGSGNDSVSLSGDVGASVIDAFNASAVDSTSGSSSGSDTGSESLTVQSGDSFSLAEQGSYQNGSYSLSCYVFSSNDSGSSDAQETDSISETVTDTGTQADSSGDVIQASVSGTYSVGTFNYTFNQGLSAGERSSGDSGSFTETTTVTETTTDTDLETFSDSAYEAGVYAAGSLSLSSVLYSQSSSSSMTQQSTDTYVSLNTQQDYSTNGGHENGFNGDGYNVSSSDTASGNGTVTGSDTTTEQSQSSQSVYQAGSFSNDSYGLASYSFSVQGSDTLTATSSDTFTSLLSGPDAGQETIDGVEEFNGSGTFTETLTGGDSSRSTQTDSWSLTELGSVSAGQLALSCYALSEQEDSSGSSADSSSIVESDSGTLTTYGDPNTYSYSGGANHSASDNQNSSSSASLLEQGVYANGSFNLSLVSYSGSGSESGSGSDGDSGSWSGTSYSSSSGDSSQSGDSGSYSMSASGAYSNGSFSLSSYVLQGSSTQSWSQSADETDYETLVTGHHVQQTGGTFSRNDTESAQESGSVYQSGVETAGSYANLSYSNVEDSAATVTDQTATQGSYSSGDTWQTSSAQTMTLSGGSATGSSSYQFQDSGDSGSGTSSVSSTQTLTTPSLLVDLIAPDASSVGIVSAEASGGGQPVSTPDVGVVDAESEWLSGTTVAAQEATQPNSVMPMVPPSTAKAPLGDPPEAQPPSLTQHATIQRTLGEEQQQRLGTILQQLTPAEQQKVAQWWSNLSEEVRQRYAESFQKSLSNLGKSNQKYAEALKNLPAQDPYTKAANYEAARKRRAEQAEFDALVRRPTASQQAFSRMITPSVNKATAGTAADAQTGRSYVEDRRRAYQEKIQTRQEMTITMLNGALWGAQLGEVLMALDAAAMEAAANAPKKTWQDFLGQAQKRMEASAAKLPPGASKMRMAAPTYPKGPISVDTALELAEQHLGGAPTKTVASGSGGVQFIREVVDPVSGKTITKIARFDINPASPHVGKLGPHLNLETQINGKTVTSGLQADPHIPIDPTTIRPGDY